MKTGFNKEHWKSLLPETYDWAAKVKLDMVSDVGHPEKNHDCCGCSWLEGFWQLCDGCGWKSFSSRRTDKNKNNQATKKPRIGS